MMWQLLPDQNALFYEFCLEYCIPQDHLLRQIDPFLDLSDLCAHLSAFHGLTGRPSANPEVTIRIIVVGYCCGIRSERHPCEEVHLNLTYRWFCRLGLEGKVPDHSTFSENRHARFRDSDVFRQLFDAVLQRCITEGLVGVEGFAVGCQRAEGGCEPLERYRDDDNDGAAAARCASTCRRWMQVRHRSASLAVGSASYTAAPGGPAFYTYSTNYLVDTDHGVIVDVESTTANRGREEESTRMMVDRVEQRFGIRPQRLIGDTAFGTAPMLHWIVDIKQIEPHPPVWDKTERQNSNFSRSDFIWDAEADRYVCPAGKSLLQYRRRFKQPRTSVPKDEIIRYRATKHDCDACDYKPRCCPNTPQRKVARSIYDSSRDVARAVAATDAYQQSRKDRKKVEMLFAHLKLILKLDRLRLRGMYGARDEFLLAATAQNLRRMAKLLGRPPPIQGVIAPA